ncbi:LppM family (lipo)protein [Gordonia neofelifaecis]|uniref:LppM domain-containing protein n=1 Tax=Gordonia neofelifaecis NRRL B-59395 TaxID=644548 RepID=F1YHL1_9ACTN|nr:hypothetical protein [Gordonia neofelifaecis]EGD55849.1 hypothetical protein SCNU_06395 [Gordonia neofelifaecis NRRL B-59395]
MTSIRRAPALALVGLLAMLPLLSGCLTKSTTVGDQFSGTVIVATSPDQHPTKPSFDIPASLSGQVWATDYPEKSDDSTAAPAPSSTPAAPPNGAPSPDGKVGSELSFDRLSAGQFSQLGDIIAAALPDPSATVHLKSSRSGDIVRFRGSASLTGTEPDSVYFSLSITFGGDVVATNGKQIGDDTVVWTPRPGQNVDMQADSEYADPATAAVPSWTWFMFLLCAIIVGMVVYAAYQNRDRSARPGRPKHEPKKAVDAESDTTADDEATSKAE